MFKVTICDIGKMNINMTDNKESKMKRFVIIFISLIVGYALYWCISDYNYRYNKINSIVGIYKSSNPQPIGFSGILLAKRQNSFYCTYFLHNRNVADTKSPYPIKRLEVIRWFNQKSMVFNQSLS